MDKSILAKNFKKLRMYKSLNQTEFAELVGVKRSSIGAYEEGRAEPKLEVLIRISEIYKLPLDDLVKTELTVNKIARFRLPEEDKVEIADLHRQLKEIKDRLTTIENQISRKDKKKKSTK